MGWLDRLKKRFRRKPPKFDYAALRIGNVYVLPPTEEDVRAFRRKRRGELTRRGFVVAGVALGLGALTTPFWLWRGGGGPAAAEASKLRRLLLDFNPAQAEPEDLRAVRLACLSLYQDPNPEIRRLSADLMGLFERDDEVLDKLWAIIDTDAIRKNRETALRSLLRSARDRDVSRLVALHRASTWARQVIETYCDAFGFVKLRRALGGR